MKRHSPLYYTRKNKLYCIFVPIGRLDHNTGAFYCGEDDVKIMRTLDEKLPPEWTIHYMPYTSRENALMAIDMMPNKTCIIFMAESATQQADAVSMIAGNTGAASNS